MLFGLLFTFGHVKHFETNQQISMEQDTCISSGFLGEFLWISWIRIFWHSSRSLSVVIYDLSFFFRDGMLLSDFFCIRLIFFILITFLVRVTTYLSPARTEIHLRIPLYRPTSAFSITSHKLIRSFVRTTLLFYIHQFKHNLGHSD